MVLFESLVAAHVVTGATGLVSLWAPVVTKKGSPRHQFWGRVFVFAMIATGAIAVGISLCSLFYPLETHTFSDDVPMIRGLFGWLMLYLGVLTVALAWHSYVAARHKMNRAAYGTRTNLALQLAMGAAAANCAVQGLLISQYLMVGIAVPGLVAATLNSIYIMQENPPPREWLVQHFRSGIGAGISVYTAFFAFGAVNTIPALAFNPILWALPTVLGVSYMLKHQLQVRPLRRRSLSGEKSA